MTRHNRNARYWDIRREHWITYRAWDMDEMNHVHEDKGYHVTKYLRMSIRASKLFSRLMWEKGANWFLQTSERGGKTR